MLGSSTRPDRCEYGRMLTCTDLRTHRKGYRARGFRREINGPTFSDEIHFANRLAGSKLEILDKNIVPSVRLGAVACDWVAEKKKSARRSGTLTARTGSFQNLSDPAMWEAAIHTVAQTHYSKSDCLDIEPTSTRCIATAFARSSAPCMIVARRKNTALDSDFRLRDCSRNVHE